MGVFADIQNILDHEPKKIKVSQQLEMLLARITDLKEKEFLREAIDCYRVKAFRAAIVMTWILVMHHLQTYVFTNELLNFNHALSKNPDKKIKVVSSYDEFSDLSESKTIELMRSAGIVSNDVRKILEEKLGVRNSAAHPSTIMFDGHNN